ncbi:uncharacterized protein, partial [Diadema setosum]|uniref:uncharacterized protein n=1 Tax=Diadema setosum TaxID=31175 RepID=UPI003B3B843F
MVTVHYPNHVFTLTEQESRVGCFRLQYSTRNDSYYRGDSSSPEVRGWKAGAFTVVNMQRYHAIKGPEKGEWAYLTRKPRHSSGSISWCVDFGRTGLVVDQIHALTYGRTLPGGTITYDMISPDRLPSFEHRLIFVAYLDGGVSKHERAQTQLFFQDCVSNPNGFPFDLLITLKPAVAMATTLIPRTKLKPNVCKRCTCPIEQRQRYSPPTVRVDEPTGSYWQDEGSILETPTSDIPTKIAERTLEGIVDSSTHTRGCEASMFRHKTDRTRAESMFLTSASIGGSVTTGK